MLELDRDLLYKEYKVLRFWEHEIKLNIKNCKEKIKEIYYGI